ncbi:hypothetical protein LTR84_012908 [Exophiala bonariae]|uniref:nitrilase n=1 Tax=Exophiala bonariae TaxID=1690606 RepID=A0AAV9NDK4_9EURO|nr:hypothetical protein LTR84_012908 [Exophiala bonariae]
MGSTETTSSSTLRVAVAQYEPEWLDLQGSVKKTCSIITEAAKRGAKILAFPECWITGYPAYIWARPLDPVLTTKYIQNSLAVDSDEMRTIQKCAAANGIVVSLGFSENDHNSVYIAQALIDSDGKILMTRRKLKPTHMERTIFGDSSGNSLINVASTKLGKRVGSLACWEHCQPLLKYHTATQREDIHVAGWPPLSPHAGPELFSMSKEGCLCLSQTYAIETQTFVLHSTTVIGQKGIDAMSTAGAILMSSPGGGYSAVVGPDGRLLSEYLEPTEEGLVIADIDTNMTIMARSFLDIVGHYSRPDLLWLGCDTREKKHKLEKRTKPEEPAEDEENQYRFIGQDKVRWKKSPWSHKPDEAVENGATGGQAATKVAKRDTNRTASDHPLESVTSSHGLPHDAEVPDLFGRQLFSILKLEDCNVGSLEDMANLNSETCVQFLNHYQDMSETSPFALRLRTTDVHALLSNSPMLLLSIILTASSSNANLQKQADRAFLQVFADKVIVQGQKAMEIFQSLLTYLNWYHLRFDAQKQQFYQFMQLANGMASDLLLPRVLSNSSEDSILTVQLIDQARALLQCYYLNVASALGFDRCETMQCPSSLKAAAQVLARAKEWPLDQAAPSMLELMNIACCHQKDMKEPKGDSQCLESLESLRETLYGWTMSTTSASSGTMLAPTYHFIVAYTFLKSKSLRQPGSPALKVGLEACQAVLFKILEKGSCHLVKLSIVEWAHLITTLFILPWLEISAIVDHPIDSTRPATPLTLYFVSIFRLQLSDLKLLSESETVLKAEILSGWLETILAAVETRARALADRFRNRSDDEETAFELVNSFLKKEMVGLPESLDVTHKAEQGRSREDSWIEFMSDWLDW